MPASDIEHRAVRFTSWPAIRGWMGVLAWIRRTTAVPATCGTNMRLGSFVYSVPMAALAQASPFSTGGEFPSELGADDSHTNSKRLLMKIPSEFSLAALDQDQLPKKPLRLSPTLLAGISSVETTICCVLAYPNWLRRRGLSAVHRRRNAGALYLPRRTVSQSKT